MTPKQIVEETRQRILDCAGGDPDQWWYANRFVFARLQQDERKTKIDIKRDLLDAGGPCHSCGEPFESRRNVHLHRLDSSKGYRSSNCVLMHAECHRQVHATTQPEEHKLGTDGAPGRPLSATKWSKCYEDMPFTYWWDISPALAAELTDDETVEFVCRDTRERCAVAAEDLKPFLTPQRQTSRSQGNWGIKVLKDRPDELAFEPPTGSDEWLFLPVTWVEEAQED